MFHNLPAAIITKSKGHNNHEDLPNVNPTPSDNLIQKQKHPICQWDLETPSPMQST